MADRETTTGTSRWQKVVAIIGLLVIIAVGIRMFGAGDDHGSGQKTPGENQQQQTDPEDGGGHEPPPWVDH